MQQGNSVDAKMDFMCLASEIMPQGKPKFLAVIKFPMIQQLIQSKGRKVMLALVVTLVKDFCDSLNVVRNMNQTQMMEAANMLLDECDNFRLEDYVMMFQLAKRGELAEIRDRIDLQLITDVMDAYWEKRHNAGEKHIVEEIRHLDSLGITTRMEETVSVTDVKLMNMSTGFSAAIGALKGELQAKLGNKEERDRLKKVEQEETQKIRQQLKERGYDK